MPRRNPLELSDFNPQRHAMKAWREERKQERELCEEARRITTDVGMKPVDDKTRLDCYIIVHVKIIMFLLFK